MIKVTRYTTVTVHTGPKELDYVVWTDDPDRRHVSDEQFDYLVVDGDAVRGYRNVSSVRRELVAESHGFPFFAHYREEADG